MVIYLSSAPCTDQYLLKRRTSLYKGRLLGKLRYIPVCTVFFRSEVYHLYTVGRSHALNMTPVFVSYKLLTYAPLATFALLGNALSNELAFVTMAMFGPVRLNMTLFVPFAITFAAEARTSAQRIQVFKKRKPLSPERASTL